MTDFMGRYTRRGIAVIAGTIAAIGALGCEEAPESDGRVQVTAQQLRAAPSAENDSVFLGLDLLATGPGQSAIPCDEGELELSAEYSLGGDDGPFIPLPEEALKLSCGELGGGDFALVVDNSGSQEGFLVELRRAARMVLNRVLPRGGRASLVRVSTQASVLTELTDSRSDLEHGLQAMHVSNGWTALYDGIRMGNETLGGAAIARGDEPRYREAGEFCTASHKLGIVAITDGRENNSTHQRHWTTSYPGDGIDTTLEDLHNLRVEGITTPIYTIGMGGNVDHDELTALSTDTGGRHMRIEHPSDIARSFEVIADYAEAQHQVCTELPVDVCGPLHVRLRYSWRSDRGRGNGNGGQEITGDRTYRIDIPCADKPDEDGDSEDPQPAPRGNFATLLFTMSDPGLPRETAQRLADQTVRWVSPVADPRVLIVLDDSHHGEDSGDAQYIAELLRDAGHRVDLLDEPEHGLGSGDIDGYDVVWFSNPGHPPDDAASIDQLLLFSHDYGGVVLQGDDMTWAYGQAFSMTAATGLTFVDNGVTYCGKAINNNNADSYQVTFSDDAHPATAGLSGLTFPYGNDIDTSTIATDTTTVLAWATTEVSQGACDSKPAIIVYTPGR